MATVIIASSKPVVSPSQPPNSGRRRPKPFHIPPFLKESLLPALKSISVAGYLAMSQPAIAVEMEKAALFDFNLTLPIIMAEFLILMVALDKIYFSPLGKFMDDRDAAIREKLNSVKDKSEEVKKLEEQAEGAAATAKMVKGTEAEIALRLAEESAKLEAELQKALFKLEGQKEETIRALEGKIALLSQEIIYKVISV